MAESSQQVEEITQKVVGTEIKSTKRKILIALDASKPAERAFDWYIENLMNESRDEVLVFHCPEYHLDFHLLSGSDEKSISKITEKMKVEQNKIGNLTSSYVQRLRGKVPAKACVITGKKPGEAICQTCRSEQVSIIVIGTRGLGAIKKAFLGSVSEYVVKHAGASVVVVKDQD